MRILALLAALLLSGCTAFNSAHFEVPHRDVRRSPQNVDSLEVRSSAEGRDHVVLGKVHAHGRCNWFFGGGACGAEEMTKRLKDEAVSLGAAALIDVNDRSFSTFEWTDVHYWGTAIAWVDDE